MFLAGGHHRWRQRRLQQVVAYVHGVAARTRPRQAGQQRPEPKRHEQQPDNGHSVGIIGKLYQVTLAILGRYARFNAVIGLW